MYSYQARLLRKRRLDRGWTQAHVSKHAGLSRNQIIAMEKGTFLGGVKYLQKYLDLLGLTISFVDTTKCVPQFDELHEIFGED